MNKKLFIEYGIAITRLYLALVFILSGIDKINDLATFAQSIENYHILPIYLVNIAAIIIPWLELVAGGLLLVGLFIRENALIIGVLTFIFTVAVLIAVIKGLDIECGCMGTHDGQRVGIVKIIENISLIIVAFLSIKFPKQALTFIK